MLTQTTSETCSMILNPLSFFDKNSKNNRTQSIYSSPFSAGTGISPISYMADRDRANTIFSNSTSAAKSFLENKTHQLQLETEDVEDIVYNLKPKIDYLANATVVYIEEALFHYMSEDIGDWDEL